MWSQKVIWLQLNGYHEFQGSVGPVTVPVPKDAMVDQEASKCDTKAGVGKLVLRYFNDAWNLAFHFNRTDKDQQFKLSGLALDATYMNDSQAAHFLKQAPNGTLCFLF